MFAAGVRSRLIGGWQAGRQAGAAYSYQSGSYAKVVCWYAGELAILRSCIRLASVPKGRRKSSLCAEPLQFRKNRGQSALSRMAKWGLVHLPTPLLSLRRPTGSRVVEQANSSGERSRLETKNKGQKTRVRVHFKGREYGKWGQVHLSTPLLSLLRPTGSRGRRQLSRLDHSVRGAETVRQRGIAFEAGMFSDCLLLAAPFICRYQARFPLCMV